MVFPFKMKDFYMLIFNFAIEHEHQSKILRQKDLKIFKNKTCSSNMTLMGKNRIN